MLRRFREPAFAGRIEASGATVGRAGSRRTGSEVVFYLRIADGQITEARFEAFGCPHTIAAADYVAENITGQALAGLRIDPHAIATTLGLPPEKLGQVLIVEDALRTALENPVPTPIDNE